MAIVWGVPNFRIFTVSIFIYSVVVFNQVPYFCSIFFFAVFLMSIKELQLLQCVNILSVKSIKIRMHQ